MTPLYRAGAQLAKVRAIMLFSLVCALGSTWWGWDLFQTYGSRPADGAVLAPVGTRLAVGFGVASIGILFAAGMRAYGRLYVSALDLDESASALRLRTLTFLGGSDRLLPRSEIIQSDYRAGEFLNPGGVSVRAPWISVRVEGRAWPFIIDAQGEFADRGLVAKVLKFR